MDSKLFSLKYFTLLNEPNMVIMGEGSVRLFNAIEIILSYFDTKVTLSIDRLIIENYGMLMKN